MLSARPRIDQNAQNVHYNLTMKTPAKPSTSNTLGASTILRTNLKENTANRAALLKTAPRAHIIPSTPILKKPVTNSITTPAYNALKESSLLSTRANNTMKMPRLLDLTNKTPFASHHLPESPKSGALESPLKAPFQLASMTSSDVPDTILRPSRARTSLRMPRMSGSGPSNALPPVTPAPEGRRKHWEVLSDSGDISVNDDSNDDLGQPAIDLEEEIEYMPPRAAELPYDPGFDMPDYKEMGASIWRIGNIFDVSTLVDIRPPDIPFVIEPDDVPSFDSIIQLEPYVEREEDLETYIGSQNLHTRFKKASSNLPSLPPSTTQMSSQRLISAQRSKTQTSLPSSSSQRAAATRSTRKADDIKVARNTRVQIGSVSVPASSSATAGRTVERTLRSRSTAQAAAEKSAVKASKAGSAQASRIPRNAATQPVSTRVTRSATATTRAARFNPPTAVNETDDDIVPELMISLSNVIDVFDFQLTLTED